MLTRDERLRINALKYMAARRRRAQAVRVLSRDEKMRRSALRYAMKASRKKSAKTVSAEYGSPEKPPLYSDKKAAPQFFFILRRPPTMSAPAGMTMPTTL